MIHVIALGWLPTPIIPFVDAPKSERVGEVHFCSFNQCDGRWIVATRGIRMPVEQTLAEVKP